MGGRAQTLAQRPELATELAGWLASYAMAGPVEALWVGLGQCTW